MRVFYTEAVWQCVVQFNAHCRKILSVKYMQYVKDYHNDCHNPLGDLHHLGRKWKKIPIVWSRVSSKCKLMT